MPPKIKLELELDQYERILSLVEREVESLSMVSLDGKINKDLYLQITMHKSLLNDLKYLKQAKEN